MTAKAKDQNQGNLYFSLRDTLNQRHPFFVLAYKIRCEIFENAFKDLYCPDNGCPYKPIRLMVGLLIQKHLRNSSDELVVEEWSENPYFQHFTGKTYFVADYQCKPSELMHFRKIIGEKGLELILEESIRTNNKDGVD